MGMCSNAALPYVKNPSLDPEFRPYFSREWCEALHLSVRNFFSEIFNGTHILSENFVCRYCHLRLREAFRDACDLIISLVFFSLKLFF